MRKSRRTQSALMLLCLLLSLAVFTPTEAHAAESVPALQWPAASINNAVQEAITSPNGNVTLPCVGGAGNDLTTYNASGQIMQTLPRNVRIDGVENCISNPKVDKNGVVYGIPAGPNSSGSYATGPNLLAYNGNTLKWKYPLQCGSTTPKYVVGANGNVYATIRTSAGMRLIGLAPEVAAGQTQPSKVLDIAIADDCSTELFPYTDGLLLRSQTHGLKYYSYGGKFLTQTTVNRFWYEKLNANGKLFDSKFISGSYTSASVSMFDPTTGQVAWTTPASTPGANVQNLSLYPLAGDRVAVLIKEQKMVSGIPATPTEYQFTLSLIGSNGVRIRSVTLPNTQGQNTFGNTRVVASGNGKLTVVRNFQMNTGLGYPSTVPGVSIGIYDPATDSWPYQQVMSGDLNKPGGPYGYSAEYNHALSGNTLFLLGNCNGNCGSITTGKKLFPVVVPGLDMDYPRGEVLTTNTPVQATPVPYVALGDSFSSGEGVPTFMDSSPCNRSMRAYSRMNGLNPYTALQLDKFVACSGAKTTHVLNGWYDASHNESPQIGALSSGNSKIATITIGGNDIFFGDFAKACIVDTCNFNSSAYATSLSAINNTIGNSLTTTYKRLLEVTRVSSTKIYVLGYPQVIANKTMSDPGDARCPYMYESIPVASGRYWEEARAARDIVTKLNTKISDTVNAIRALDADNGRLIFVSATESNSPFNGHEVCSTEESYFQNVDQALNGLAYVFHPNAKGQAAYAQLVRQAIGE